jgi:hypothetical protein
MQKTPSRRKQSRSTYDAIVATRSLLCLMRNPGATRAEVKSFVRKDKRVSGAEPSFVYRAMKQAASQVINRPRSR